MIWKAIGLLGLLTVAVLIVIYILKPNYQQRIVSSTHVWKLSLRYKKEKNPISRWRNILIFICQVLILSISTFIFTKPLIAKVVPPPISEKIMIIDASAGMLARQGGDATRFERAVLEVRNEGQQAIARQEVVTVILAGIKAAPILMQESDQNKLDKVMDNLLALEMGRPKACTFGPADIDGAMALAEGRLTWNPSADVTLYTATTYKNTGRVKIVDVSKLATAKEWNAAILGCNVDTYENKYRFAVEVASYNNDKELTVCFVAYGVNGADISEEMPGGPVMAFAYCVDNKSTIVRFNNLDIYSYGSVHIYVDENDSFSHDNHFYLYGGEKETIRMLYVSPARSNFYMGVLASLPVIFESRWNISFDVATLDEINREEDKKLEDYDFYIIEQPGIYGLKSIPDILPKDGVVLLVNPDEVPADLGLVLGKRIDKLTAEEDSCKLYPGESSQIMNFINPNSVFIRQYTEVVSYEPGFKPLMYFRGDDGDDPVFLVKNEKDSKIVIITYASLYSDFSISAVFPTMLYNMFNCMFPTTIKDYIYDVDQPLTFDQSEAVLNETRPSITVDSITMAKETVYDTFPYVISGSVPGTYTTTQTLLSGRKVTEKYFVKVAASESDFTRVATFEPPAILEPPLGDLDIFVYLAAAAVALLFVERLLHMKDEF